MNTIILSGTFYDEIKTYCSKKERYHFFFKFVRNGSYIDIYCTKHPSLNGRNSNPEKTHLFSSGKICFIDGREPKTQSHAEKLAAQWAEYFLEYRRTGRTQN